ncbi:MAG: hypothetical protein ACR2PV_05095 [Gammaproteobacteria bacterium]
MTLLEHRRLKWRFFFNVAPCAICHGGASGEVAYFLDACIAAGYHIRCLIKVCYIPQDTPSCGAG